MVEKFPQFTPLIVDLLIKKEQLIPAALKESIKSYFSHVLSEGVKYPEYMLISIVRLLGTESFSDSGALMELFRSLKRNSGSYIGHTVLDSLSKNITRTEVLEIRQYYPRADLWEKRSIIKIVDTMLSEEEKRRWLKNVKVHSSDDYFAIESFDPKKEKK